MHNTGAEDEDGLLHGPEYCLFRICFVMIFFTFPNYLFEILVKFHGGTESLLQLRGNIYFTVKTL